MKKNFKINKRARRDMLCPKDSRFDMELEEEILEEQFERKRFGKMENKVEEDED